MWLKLLSRLALLSDFRRSDKERGFGMEQVLSAQGLLYKMRARMPSREDVARSEKRNIVHVPPGLNLPQLITQVMLRGVGGF